MKISKIKAAWALLTGGIAGGIKFLLGVFNDQILSRIPNKEAGVKYLNDIHALSGFLTLIMRNHEEELSEKRVECLKVIISAIDALAKALEDFKISEEELDMIIVRINEAIDVFKRAK